MKKVSKFPTKSSSKTLKKDDLTRHSLDLLRLVESLEHLVIYGRDDPDSKLDVELLATLIKGHLPVANELYESLDFSPDFTIHLPV